MPCRRSAPTTSNPNPGVASIRACSTRTGGIVDDLVVLCLAPDHYLLTAAAFNVGKTPGWVRGHVEDMDVEIEDLTSGTTIIEIQGPKSRDILQKITDADLSNEALPYFRFVETKVAGIDCIVARLGVTGELGYEIIYDPGYAYTMYDAIMEAGKDDGLQLCGNKTVGVFRLEKVYHIYTRDIDESTNPFEACLDKAVKLDKEDFVGRDALLRIKQQGVSRKLVGFEIIEGSAAAAPGTPIEIDGRECGKATFAGFSPTLDKTIGIGYVPAEHAGAGTALVIRTEPEPLKATVVEIPFFDPKGDRIRM